MPVSAQEALAQVKPLYVTHCARCHGADGRGDPAMLVALKPPPRDFRERPWKHPIDVKSIRGVILNGIPQTAMTPYRGLLSEEQAEALAAYVLQLSESDLAEATSNQSTDSVFQWHTSPQSLPDAQLVNSEGSPLRLSELNDKPLLIHFWGTTCVHCLAEMAEMKERGVDDKDREFHLISICVDTTDVKQAADLANQFAPEHPICVDRSGLAGQQFGVSSLPAYRIVNDGQIVASHVGTLPWERVDLKAVFERAKTITPTIASEE